MKVVHRQIAKDGEGRIGLIPEDPDDLWYIYNLIQKGNYVQAPTWRKVINETSTGSTGAQRMKITLTLSAEKIEYDSEANIVKVKGKNVEENKHVKKGQYHTIDLEISKRFFLTKPVWDSLSLSQLNNVCDKTRNSEVAVVIMHEGLANICLLTTNMSILKAKIEVNVPRKRKNFCSSHQKGLDNFYEQILQSMLRYVNFDTIKCIIVASPGFLKDEFMKYVWEYAAKCDCKALLTNRAKFLITHSSTGFKHSIKEILSNPEIQTKLEDTKAVQEIRLWNKFQDLLNTDPNKAIYGVKEIEVACGCEAIASLMISDSLFRSNDLVLRKKISIFMKKVVNCGGEVRIFSSMHQTGQQLNQLSGISAILKFEVPELKAIQEEDDCVSSSDSDSTTDCSSISSRESN